MSVIHRVVRAFIDGRLRAAVARRLPFYDRWLGWRLGVPEVSGTIVPVVVTDGDFSSTEGQALKAALESALSGSGKLPAKIRAIKGMSGQRYRTLINTLIERLDHPRYLEIGSWLGSTAAAAIFDNSVRATCIDNWSQFSGNKDQFLINIEQARSSAGQVRLVEQDFRRVDYRALGKFNVYLFDGPHSEDDHWDGIRMVQECLEDRFILVIDDWNWRSVRRGTMAGLKAAKCRVESSIQVRTTLDNTEPFVEFGKSDWHNGYLVAVVQKA